jgi:hypothetical protein
LKSQHQNLNILVFATTLGADLLSAVRYLEEQPGVRLKILLDDPDNFKKEPIYKVNPPKSELIKRSFFNIFFGIRGFKADVTLMDNRLPFRKTSPKALMLWHGFGWKGPNDVKELKWLHRDIRKNWRSAKVPNNDFRWQCFGPHDFEHRTRISGFHPENCVQLGAMSHDELRIPIDKATVQSFYPFDIINKKTILFAPTWHYGEVFAHWGNDKEILENLFEYTKEKGVNMILRFHDSFRFDEKYIANLKEFERRYDHISLKFKDQHPDNMLDLQVADILMTNYSSIVNLYYATGKPSIHIYPVKSEDEIFQWRQFTLMGMKTKSVDSVRYIWKFDPADNGGLLVRSYEELIKSIETALEEPDCCKQKSEAFLKKHMLGADGKNRERLYKYLLDFAKQ